MPRSAQRGHRTPGILPSYDPVSKNNPLSNSQKAYWGVSTRLACTEGKGRDIDICVQGHDIFMLEVAVDIGVLNAERLGSLEVVMC